MPSADRGSALAIEAAGAQARHLWVDLGQALKHKAEIQSRELAGVPRWNSSRIERCSSPNSCLR
jgi:hypothetical protein